MLKINHKILKVIYQSGASYDDLLQLSNSVSFHQQHLETYKSTGTLNAQFMWSYFKYREVPLTWDGVQYFSFHPQILANTNSIHFLGSLIWNKLPNLFKSSRSISEFKNFIKQI